jgi:hypothetical protein
MNPAIIKNATRNLGPPPDVSSSDCGRLFVRDVKEDGFIGMKSAWKPTPEELQILNAGGCVMLTVFSSIHPMVSIGASADEESEADDIKAPRNISGTYPSADAAIDALTRKR